MGEQRGLAPLLTVDLAPVTVELNLRESGARFPCKWSSVLEIYKETTPIEKKFDFVAFFVCFPVVTYLAPQISSYQIDGVTSGCFGIQLVWCLKLLYIQFHDPEGNTPE